MSNKIPVGINGAGRIGRQVLKRLTDHYGGLIEVVAINDLLAPTTIVSLLRNDSNYGRWNREILAAEGGITIDGRFIRIFAERDPGQIPWGELGVKIVIESTGFFTDATKAAAHRRDSVQKVIISAPAKNEDGTFVLGINDEAYDPTAHHIISNASCTTNGLAPVVRVIESELGIIAGQMSTIHSYTNSQKILDQGSPSGDEREMRAGPQNIVPGSTGAAKALKLVIGEVDGKLDGGAYRVPTPTVSIVELVAWVGRETTKDEVNDLLIKATKEGPLVDILGWTDEPVVSMDMKGDTRSSIVDGQITNVVGGRLVKVAAWYDNEWGYACRLADLTHLVAGKL